jgi:hypothetical protein
VGFANGEGEHKVSNVQQQQQQQQQEDSYYSSSIASQ